MNTLIKYSAVVLAGSVLAACGSSSSSSSDSDSDSSRDYEVTVYNFSHNQPLSPIAIVAHDDSYSAWSVGEAASVGLERLAEDGDNSVFIGDELDGKEAIGVSGTDAVEPGGAQTIEISIESDDQDYLTIASMFVNTNDAFVGIGGIDVSSLEEGESMTLTAPIYDAGTERNTEAAGTIPGPADGGAGFDAARDDIADKVSRHAGVVSADDGLSTSVLDQSHRFDNPGMKITITRQ